MKCMLIHYDFDPTQIHDLREWTFRLRFRIPGVIFRLDASKAAGALRSLDLEVSKLLSVDHRHFSLQGRDFSFRVHVPDEARRAPDGLEKYEADFWRIMSRMYALGFREVSYVPDEQPQSVGESIAAEVS